MRNCIFISTVAEYRKRFASICNGIHSSNILTRKTKPGTGASSMLAYSHSFPVKYCIIKKSLFGAFRSWSCFPQFLLGCIYIHKFQLPVLVPLLEKISKKYSKVIALCNPMRCYADALSALMKIKSPFLQLVIFLTSWRQS